MNLSEILKQTYFNLKANKLRSFLTLSGITWGVVAIMILLGWGFGFREFVWTGMTKMGQNIIVIGGGRTSKDIGGYKSGRRIRLKIEDAEILKENCPLIKEAMPNVHSWGFEVKRGKKFREEYVRGIPLSAKRVCNWSVADGRFFTPFDMEKRARVTFLGYEIKQFYFGNKRAVGKTLNIRGVDFTVIGVGKDKEPQMSSMNRQDNRQILVPFSTFQTLWYDNEHVNNIWLQPKDFKKSEIVIREARKILSKVHRFSPDDEEAMQAFDMNFYYELVRLMVAGINILLFLIGTITLFIGSIGVMNIMLVSVQERTREIGIRKAVGARKKDIKRQFLGETLSIMFLGGTVGLLIGIGIITLVTNMNLPPMIPLPENSLLLDILVVTILTLTGMFSGYIPAKRAAELPPIHALHYERGEVTVGTKVAKPLWQPKTQFGDLINEALSEIRTSKLRSFLTMFGITWGIAAVIILLGFGKGFEVHFKKLQGRIGLERITIYPLTAKKEIGNSVVEKPIRFTMTDIEALNNSGIYIKYAEPDINLWWYPVAKYKNESRSTHMLGIAPRTKELRNFEVEYGRFINDRDINESRRVCVVGATIRERLFKNMENSDILGKNIRIDGISYKVVGLLKKKGWQMSINNSLDDEKILLPYSTARKNHLSSKYINRILLMPENPAAYKKTFKQIRRILARKHGFNEDDEHALGMYSMMEGIEEMAIMGLGLKVFLGGVAIISLLVGGIGIMNIMLFLVMQRIREIGVRRAIGARKKHIFFQFLLETLLITVIAGIVGFSIGYAVNYLINQLPLPDMFFPPVSSLGISIFTMLILVITGFLSGITPAARAMKLNIIDALRYE